jgi:hypothetical protein
MNGWLSFLLALAAMLILRWIYQFFFTPSGRFWRLVAAQPDIALTVFSDHPYCVLDGQPTEIGKYAGPFSFMDSKGQRHKVYILAEHIEGVQARCADTINGVAAVLDRAAKMKADRQSGR